MSDRAGPPSADGKPATLADALAELERVRHELAESRDILRAIGAGEVDAFVVTDGPERASVFTLETADGPYRRFVENMSDGAATVSLEGSVLYANTRLVEMLARPREAIVGASLSSLVSGDQPVSWDRMGRAEASVVVDLVDPEGRVLLPVLIGASELAAGPMPVTCLTFTSLAAHRAQEHEIAQLHRTQLADGLRFTAMVESLQEGVIVQDEQGRVLEANRKASEILGIERDRLVTEPPSPLVWSDGVVDPSRMGEGGTPGRRALAEGKPQLGVVVAVERLGVRIWLEINSVPLRLPGESEEAVVISSFRDVTDRIAADAEIRFQALLLDTAGQAIIAVDGDGVILYWNKHAEQMYGWLATEAVGRLVSELILPPQTVAEGEDMVASMRSSAGPTWASDHWVTRRDGSLFPVFATTTPVFDDDGALVARISVATDITDRKAAEDQARRLSAIVESSSDAIVGMSLDRVITSWNPGAVALFGYDTSEAVGHHVSMLAPSLADDAGLEPMASGRELSISNLETRFLTKTGDVVTISLSLSPILDEHGESVGVSGIGRDITEVLELEHLAELNREALLVARHEAELAALARKEADRANRAKSEFLSRMSHELRTPLNAVLGFAQVLQMQDLKASQRESVGYIRSAGDHLLALITDVMEISRIDAGSLDLSMEAVHVDDVVDSALNLIRPQAEQRQIVVSSGFGGSDLYVWADRQRLLQVLLNLLSNAVKYNRVGGRIDLTGASADGTVSIAVTDTGIGISESNQAKLFTPFERLGAQDTTVEGTGVGLALSCALAQEMGGSILVASVTEVGSTFTLELPACRPSEPTSGPPRSSAERPGSADEAQLVVVVIEDNVANVRLMEQAIERAGNVTMHSAVDGQRGRQLAAELQPDVILLDLHLPDEHGESVLAQLRADPATASTPVVICSADARPGLRQRLLDRGAWAFLTKPIDLDELYDVLDRVRAGGPPTPPGD